MNVAPSDEDRDFAADILEEFYGDTLDSDRMTELISEVAYAFAYVRGVTRTEPDLFGGVA